MPQMQRNGSNRAAPKNPNRKLTAIKILPDDLKEIDRRAKRAGLTRTDYMLRKALDKPIGDENHGERLDGFEERLKRLEEVSFGAAR